MLRSKLHYLIGVATGTVVSYGMISTQLVQPTQAAVLTSNFQVYNIDGEYFDGVHQGTFNFDNSSLTGKGQEWTNVLSGVFNFLKPALPPHPYAYDLSSGRVSFLDGKFMGLSASGISWSDERIDVRVLYFTVEPMIAFLYRGVEWSIEPMNPDGQHTFLALDRRQNGRLTSGHYGKIAYSEPAELETVPVPEPTTIIGTAFAFASLVQLKRKRKNYSSSPSKCSVKN